MDSDVADRTLADVLSDRTRRRRHRPLLTFYDDATGTRTELSYATADNWAGKAANLLVEDLGIARGSVVGFDLDGHWTASVLALACWKVGAAVDPGPDRADVLCCHESRATAHPTGALVVVGDGLRAEPVGGLAPRPGVVLFGEEVHAFGDEYVDPGVGPDLPALRTAGVRWDHATVVCRARRWREMLGTDVRVGLAAPLDSAEALVLLAGVLVAGGSLVAARRPAGPQVDRWTAERVTALVGADDALAGMPADVPRFPPEGA